MLCWNSVDDLTATTNEHNFIITISQVHNHSNNICNTITVLDRRCVPQSGSNLEWVHGARDPGLPPIHGLPPNPSILKTYILVNVWVQSLTSWLVTSLIGPPSEPPNKVGPRPLTTETLSCPQSLSQPSLVGLCAASQKQENTCSEALQVYYCKSSERHHLTRKCISLWSSTWHPQQVYSWLR